MPDKELKTLGTRLKEEMKKKHLTALEISNTLGFSRNRIGKILNDQLMPDYLTMIGLKTILRLNNTQAVSIFFTGIERGDVNGRSTGHQRPADING